MFDFAKYGSRKIFTVYYAIKVLAICIRIKSKKKKKSPQIPWFYLSRKFISPIMLGAQVIIKGDYRKCYLNLCPFNDFFFLIVYPNIYLNLSN